jgi:malonyl-CoA O-methyltransferase
MNVIDEFSRFANLYDKYNIVQSKVAIKLVSMVEKSHYKSILDIGCGSGLIYKKLLRKNISFNNFIATDFSKKMLNIHPNSPSVKKVHLNFNNRDDFSKIGNYKYDFVISSSALQWSLNLDMTLKEISRLSHNFYISFFTSNTFLSLHKIAGVESPIHSKESIKSVVNRYFNASFKTVEYKLKFANIYEMLRYIKRSGVSGGKKQLSYRDVKKIIELYPLNHLEFEVLFIKATSKGYDE